FCGVQWASGAAVEARVEGELAKWQPDTGGRLRRDAYGGVTGVAWVAALVRKAILALRRHNFLQRLHLALHDIQAHHLAFRHRLRIGLGDATAWTRADCGHHTAVLLPVLPC